MKSPPTALIRAVKEWVLTAVTALSGGFRGAEVKRRLWRIKRNEGPVNKEAQAR